MEWLIIFTSDEKFFNDLNLIGDQVTSSSTDINSEPINHDNKEKLLEVLFVSSGNMKNWTLLLL